MRSLIRLIRQAGDELSNAAGVLGEAEDGEGNPSFTDKIGEELLEGEEKNPSLAEITVEGYPPEWIPLIILCAILFLIIIFFYWKAISMHKKYSTRHPIQFFCVMGILTLYPFFVLMNLSGMIVPKSLVVVTFLAEAYEGLSFVFFLRLVIYLMGGKKETKANLKGGHVHLNVPPLCCLCCLPSIKFSTAYYVFNECLILQYVVIQLIFGYIDLMMGLDGSTAHPADLIEEGYAHILYVVLIISLLVAIYGLSGIYHSAEETLSHYNIFKKFIAYKLLVSLAKVQSVLFAALVDWKVISGVAFGSFSDHLRVHLWSSTLIIVECAIVFPIAMKYYPVEDYPTLRDEVVKFSVNNEGHQVAMIDQEKRASIGERLQHHAMTDRYQKLNSHEDDVENGEAGNGGVALEISTSNDAGV